MSKKTFKMFCKNKFEHVFVVVVVVVAVVVCLFVAIGVV